MSLKLKHVITFLKITICFPLSRRFGFIKYNRVKKVNGSLIIVQFNSKSGCIFCAVKLSWLQGIIIINNKNIYKVLIICSAKRFAKEVDQFVREWEYKQGGLTMWMNCLDPIPTDLTSGKFLQNTTLENCYACIKLLEK